MASMRDKLASLGDRMNASLGVGTAEAVEAIGPQDATPAGKLAGVKVLHAAKLIDLDRIEPDQDQPRKEFDHEKILDLAKSLEKHGQLQPIRVIWREDRGKYMIVSGERRWRAARLTTKVTQLQCVVVDRLDEAAIRQQQLIENCLREDLAPLEQAAAFKTLMNTNDWSARKLADELHLSHPTVLRALSLLDLPENVRERVAAGELAPTTAAEIATLGNPEAQAALAERVVAERLTRSEAAAAARQTSGRTPAPARKGRAEYRLDDGRKVVVTGMPGDGPAQFIATLKAALKLAQAEARDPTRDQAA
jgi:ParB family chromosome partitioning protein